MQKKLSNLLNKDLIDSKSFASLSPLMKEAITDVFNLIEKETGDIIEKFESAVDKVAEHHNINTQLFYDYFDKELDEQLGE
jgi:hypothetical protein